MWNKNAKCGFEIEGRKFFECKSLFYHYCYNFNRDIVVGAEAAAVVVIGATAVVVAVVLVVVVAIVVVV
ncbi:hypothetical protein ElyMa_000423100 [Elysia marginata]|uniref:Uncharacterized protein n=1 Tax=Elysia marginata TaxID=1093978 RepID=A0AAV4FMJ0_9GAST|nr:hypothetical protein ElyMa_000423100 [Elysia marginata]